MKDKKLTVTFYVGDKRVEHLTAEQLDRMAERLTKAMSRYYNSHLDEFLELKD